MANDRSNLKQNGGLRYPFLPLSHRDEQTGTHRTAPLSLMGQSNISSLSPSTKSAKEGMVNYSNLESYSEWFCVLATKSGTKEKIQELKPYKCLGQQERPCSFLTLLAEARAKRKQVFQVKCLSEDNFIGLYGG